MEIDYSSNRLKKSFSDWNSLKKDLQDAWIRKIKIYYQSFLAADTFQIFLDTSLDHPEPLEGYRNPTWTLRITANVRLVFELSDKKPSECKKITIKGVADDHGGKYTWYIS